MAMRMEGDSETLKRDGFVIVRGCVASGDGLDAARATWEALLDRQREVRFYDTILGYSALAPAVLRARAP
jgi:hypothetical protein